MKFSLVSVLALASGALAGAYSNDTVVYETITTTAITTYCPEATTIVHGTQTYTVTEATTLTITDCPCTVTQPIISKPTPSTVLYTSCPPTSDSAEPTTYPAGPPAPSGPIYTNPLATYPAGAPPTTKPAGATKPISSEKASGTASHATPATSYPATFTGAANQVGGGLVVGAAAAAALAAFAL